MTTSLNLSALVSLLALTPALAAYNFKRPDLYGKAIPDVVPEIFEGEIVTDPEEFPAFALQCFRGATDCSGCGGTLITPTHVLTAAHCINIGGILDPPTHVRVGALTSTDGEYIEVDSYVIHPNYDPENFPSGFDIAVLTLAEASTATPQAFNRDVSYPSGTEEVPVTAYGFGGFNANGDVSTELRKAPTTILDDETCSGVFFDYLPDSEVCTFNAEEGICAGDSGGPVLDASGTVLGMLSYGSAFCGEGTIDVWTDPAAYAEWIDEQTATTGSPTVAGTVAPTTGTVVPTYTAAPTPVGTAAPTTTATATAAPSAPGTLPPSSTTSAPTGFVTGTPPPSVTAAPTTTGNVTFPPTIGTSVPTTLPPVVTSQPTSFPSTPSPTTAPVTQSPTEPEACFVVEDRRELRKRRVHRHQQTIYHVQVYG